MYKFQNQLVEGGGGSCRTATKCVCARVNLQCCISSRCIAVIQLLHIYIFFFRFVSTIGYNS